VWADSALALQILETNWQMLSGESIEIHGLEVQGRIGVPESERKSPQRLLVTLRYQLETSFAALNDQLAKTVDYASVAFEVDKIVGASRAHLVEKLVSEIGEALMARFPMQRLEIELRKFILPNAQYVSVKSDWKREKE
jgi:dihydroneopterin aldolase